MFQGKKILLAVTGSIAAYKSILLVRLLVKAGADVKVVMTPAAKDFVSPLTLSTLSKNPVVSDLFNNESWSNHVEMGRWADVMVVAPLSCNTLAKMANGLCDNMLLATYLSATCPVVVAPAMDEDMWHHPTTRQNLQKLESFGNKIIPVEKGELASGLYGDGRMAEPETIMRFLEENFFLSTELAGKKALVTGHCHCGRAGAPGRECAPGIGTFGFQDQFARHSYSQGADRRRNVPGVRKGISRRRPGCDVCSSGRLYARGNGAGKDQEIV
jgi:phosphopantothenoylcysteine decarboxylase/phosphopantothenate--cysteine ligase